MHDDTSRSQHVATLRKQTRRQPAHHEAGLAAHGLQRGHAELLDGLQAQVGRQISQRLQHAAVDVLLAQPPLRSRLQWSIARQKNQLPSEMRVTISAVTALALHSLCAAC